MDMKVMERPTAAHGVCAPLVDRRATRRPTRKSFDQRLAAILQAATRVIAREGYRKASMRAVAREAGVSLAGLYHYFGSKDEMLYLIQLRTFRSLIGHLREELAGLQDPAERLRVLVSAHVQFFVSNMAALKVCSHELDALTGDAYAETRSIRFEYYKLARSVVNRLLAQFPERESMDLHVVTMLLFGMLNWLYRWYDPARGQAPHELSEQIVSLFLGGVIGAPASVVAP